MALTAKQRRDLAEAISYAKYGMWKQGAVKPAVKLDSIPGFSPMQLKTLLDKMTKARQELEILQKENEQLLNKKKELEDVEDAGIAQIKEAVKNMAIQGKHCVESEKLLIEWISKIKTETPGIEQLLADPANIKDNERAGELIKHIADEFGTEVAAKVEQIIADVRKSLTYTHPVAGSFKVLMKTASINRNIVKAAGILDAISDFKDWLAGKAKATWGTLKDWVKGFADRAKQTEEAKDSIKKFVDTYSKELDKLVKD